MIDKKLTTLKHADGSLILTIEGTVLAIFPDYDTDTMTQAFFALTVNALWEIENIETVNAQGETYLPSANPDEIN